MNRYMIYREQDGTVRLMVGWQRPGETIQDCFNRMLLGVPLALRSTAVAKSQSTLPNGADSKWLESWDVDGSGDVVVSLTKAKAQKVRQYNRRRETNLARLQGLIIRHQALGNAGKVAQLQDLYRQLDAKDFNVELVPIFSLSELDIYVPAEITQAEVES